MIRVLFVCLGNICRSPIAEGVFRARVARELGFDSAQHGFGIGRRQMRRDDAGIEFRDVEQPAQQFAQRVNSQREVSGDLFLPFAQTGSVQRLEEQVDGLNRLPKVVACRGKKGT